MKDNFEKHIKDKLVGHKLEVPERVWENIKRNQKSKWYGTRYFKSIVAIVLLLIISIPFLHRKRIDPISIITKPIYAFEINRSSHLPIKRIPTSTYRQENKPKKILRSVEIPELNIEQEEIIVLKINPQKYRKTKSNLPQTTKPKLIINPDDLLKQIEEQIIAEDETKLEKYISKVKEFTKVKKLNISVRSTSDWVKKTLNRKNKTIKNKH